MKKLPFSEQIPNKLDWYDSRLFHPETTSYDNYICIIRHSESLFLEIVGFQPTNNYTDGEWDCSENSKVLWWSSSKFWLPDLNLNGYDIGNSYITGRLLGHLCGKRESK